MSQPWWYKDCDNKDVENTVVHSVLTTRESMLASSNVLVWCLLKQQYFCQKTIQKQRVKLITFQPSGPIKSWNIVVIQGLWKAYWTWTTWVIWNDNKSLIFLDSRWRNHPAWLLSLQVHFARATQAASCPLFYVETGEPCHASWLGRQNTYNLDHSALSSRKGKNLDKPDRQMIVFGLVPNENQCSMAVDGKGLHKVQIHS